MPTAQPCWSASPGKPVTVRVRGYLQHGPAHVAISLDVQISRQRFTAALRWHDPRSHLDLSGLRFSRPQITCHGMRLQGNAGVGKQRQVPFVLQVTGLQHGKTTPAPMLDLTLRALRYRLHDVLRGPKSLTISYTVAIHQPTHKQSHP